MNHKPPHNSTNNLEYLLAEIDARRKNLNERFPEGPEAHIANYREWLRTELTYSSNALEGSTLTDIETRMVLQEDAVIPNRTLREHLEARDHALAWDYAVDVLQQQPGISTAELLTLHEKVLYSSNHEEAGIFRRGRIRVAGSTSVFPNPLKVPELVDQLMASSNDPSDAQHPVERAATIHLELVKIHPFTDGNGRAARILMNVLLRRNGYVAILIYPQDRLDYLNAIESSNSDGGASFCRLTARLELRSMDDLLAEHPGGDSTDQ